MANKICVSCRQSYNALNGCYCTLLNRYVEHAVVPPCANIPIKKSEKK